MALACIHFFAFLASLFLLQQGHGWSAIIILPLWMLVDFPISVAYLLFWGTSLDPIIEGIRASNAVMDYLFYPPTLIHGVFGTVWWGCFPKLYRYIRSGRALT